MARNGAEKGASRGKARNVPPHERLCRKVMVHVQQVQLGGYSTRGGKDELTQEFEP